MSEDYIKFLTKDSSLLQNPNSGNLDKDTKVKTTTNASSFTDDNLSYNYISPDVSIKEASADTTLFSNFSLEKQLPLIFVVTVGLLLAMIFYINANHEPKEVALDNDENMPALNIGGVLGDKTNPNKQVPSRRETPQYPQPTNPNAGPIYDPSSFRPSTKAHIVLDPPVSEGETIDLYSRDFLLKGDLGLDGDEFYLSVYVNGTEDVIYSIGPDNNGKALSFDGASIKVASDIDHDFNKFIALLDTLNGGDNSIRIAVFSDKDRMNKLDQLKFNINRKNPESDVKVEFANRKNIDKKEFFSQINADLEGDKIWQYLPPVDVNWKDYTAEDFYGNGSNLKEYNIYEVGKAKIDGQEHSAYSITYFYGEGEDAQSSYILGYKEGSDFYYFDNATKTDSSHDLPVLSYMKPAKYTLKSTIIENSTVELDGSDGALYSDESPYVCKQSDKSKGELGKQDDYTVYKNLVVEDPFGICREMFYRGDYFKSQVFGGNDFIDQDYNKDFKKLDIDFDDAIKTDGYYSMFKYNCEDKSLREMDSGFESHLDEVGKTSDDLKVYILKDSAPIPSNPFDYGLMKYKDAKDASSIDSDEWKDLLKEQDEDYPLILVKNEFGGYFLFVNSDYIYVPEC